MMAHVDLTTCRPGRIMRNLIFTNIVKDAAYD